MKIVDLNKNLGLNLTQTQINDMAYRLLASGLKIGDNVIPEADIDVIEQYLRSVEAGDILFNIQDFLAIYNKMKRNLKSKIVKL